jgi:hypothetical protein
MVEEVEEVRTELQMEPLVGCVDFTTEKSAMLVRGPITVLRPELPKVPAGAATNAAGETTHPTASVHRLDCRLRLSGRYSIRRCRWARHHSRMG